MQSSESAILEIQREITRKYLIFKFSRAPDVVISIEFDNLLVYLTLKGKIRIKN